jgi:hypothetical protein
MRIYDVRSDYEREEEEEWKAERKEAYELWYRYKDMKRGYQDKRVVIKKGKWGDVRNGQ